MLWGVRKSVRTPIGNGEKEMPYIDKGTENRANMHACSSLHRNKKQQHYGEFLEFPFGNSTFGREIWMRISDAALFVFQTRSLQSLDDISMILKNISDTNSFLS